jgi:tyrosyl-DNA phosphodiesterase-1
LDSDVKDLVQVRIVHGSWKAEDAQRIRLEESVKRYPNAKIIVAHMPEVFGTHHTKMMVLIRHNNTAQIIIHTANMILQDWTNLTQAVWRSPMLPLLSGPPSSQVATSTGRIGTGTRFKFDFLRYLKAYSGRTKSLVDQLFLHDFTSIKAALIASTPSRVNLLSAAPAKQTSWGWPGLREILSIVPCKQEDTIKQASIVAQVSSIATLTEKWLDNFTDVLTAKIPQNSSSFFGSKTKTPRVQVIFPTAQEIRQSLDGYASGSSIHMKLQSAVQQKQLAIMKPMFCHWMGDVMNVSQESEHRARVPGSDDTIAPILPKREALRGMAAPHIKTYIRFSGAERNSIQWALVTSANLSTQAWGALVDKDNSVKICSYELGVVLWPELFREEDDKQVWIVPTFGKDTPDLDEVSKLDQIKGNGKTKQIKEEASTVIGFRMPYDLPLVPYGGGDFPWCATSSYRAPDAFGRIWDRFEPR